MALVEDSAAGGFTFIWSICNFGYYVNEEPDYIGSPEFEAAVAIAGPKWHLRLYPNGDGATGFISCYLQNGICVDNYNKVDFMLSIKTCNGKYKEFGKQSLTPISHRVCSVGFKFFLSVNELNEPDSYLDDDTLTLRCRMWKSGSNPSESVKCYAHTKLKFSQIDYMWILNEVLDPNNSNEIIKNTFNQAKYIKPFSGIPFLKIQLLYGGTYGDDTIHFAIGQVGKTIQCFFVCMIHVLDADGGVVHSVRGEYLFQESDNPHMWTSPFISKSKLLSNEKLYLSDGRLILRCELSASTGNAHGEIERFEYGRIDDPMIPDPGTSIQTKVPDLSELWKGNMQRLYQDGKFSDVTVRTPNRQFPVHKAILCAQSEVFSAMFERDMKENRTGVVEIEDLEDNTISKMLMFLYTNTFEDLDYAMARNLYFAADKYRITALHEKCSKYLIHGLNTSNVCDVLELADTHQDRELKSVAQDFIFVHDREIIYSADWKKLMEAKSHLTSETMQLMFCKKFLYHPNP